MCASAPKKAFVYLRSGSFQFLVCFVTADCSSPTDAALSPPQPARRASNLERLHGEDVPGCYQLPPCSGIRHDEPGSSLCHCPPELLRTEEHLRPLHVCIDICIPSATPAGEQTRLPLQNTTTPARYLAPVPAEHAVWVCAVSVCECTGVWTHGAFLIRIQKLPRLLVTTSDGHLYIYNLDPQDGGECVLIKKHR